MALEEQRAVAPRWQIDSPDQLDSHRLLAVLSPLLCPLPLTPRVRGHGPTRYY